MLAGLAEQGRRQRRPRSRAGPAPTPACLTAHTPGDRHRHQRPGRRRHRRGCGQGAVRRPRQDPRALRALAEARAAVSHRDAVSENVAPASRRPTAPLHKIEVLGDGQQFVAFGIHPDTKAPYIWHDDMTPLNTPRAELAEVTEADMQAYLELVAERLEAELGYTRTYTNGHGAEPDEARGRPGRRRRAPRGDALRRRPPPRPTVRHGVDAAQTAWASRKPSPPYSRPPSGRSPATRARPGGTGRRS